MMVDAETVAGDGIELAVAKPAETDVAAGRARDSGHGDGPAWKSRKGCLIVFQILVQLRTNHSNPQQAVRCRVEYVNIYEAGVQKEKSNDGDRNRRCRYAHSC
jgi:hypothetical protein